MERLCGTPQRVFENRTNERRSWLQIAGFEQVIGHLKEVTKDLSRDQPRNGHK